VRSQDDRDQKALCHGGLLIPTILSSHPRVARPVARWTPQQFA
jgi:hypothetical protein